jgi:hypothetical protein
MSRAIVAAAVLAGSVATAPAGAVPLTFTYGGVQTGAAPAGSPPWLTALFEDIDPDPSGTFSRVRLTLTANLQGAGEFITNARFNLNPALDGTLLSNPVYVAPDNAIVDFKTSNNGIPGPGGLFDFEFSFPTAAGDGRFTDKEVFVAILAYPIRLHDLTAADFDFLSEPDGNAEEKELEKKKAEKGLFAALAELDEGSTPRYSLAHVQGIGPSASESGWIFVGSQNGVPEPGTLALLGIVAVGFGVASRRKRG